MTYCTSCGHLGGPGDRSCTTCGAPLPAPGLDPQGTGGHAVGGHAVGGHAVGGHAPGRPAAGDLPLPEAPRRPLPLVAGGVAAAVVLTATVGVLLGSGSGDSDGAVRTASTSPGRPTSTSTVAPPPAVPQGPPRALQPSLVTADCAAPPSQDASRRVTTFEPANVADDAPDTAWRCGGAAVGRSLVLRFPAPVLVTSVGLLPGYAKVDPVDGTDRFRENRTVTGVRWTFDDGSTVQQDIPDPGPALVSVPVTASSPTSTVTLTITSTGNDGAVRDYTPISGVEVVGTEAAAGG